MMAHVAQKPSHQARGALLSGWSTARYAAFVYVASTLATSSRVVWVGLILASVVLVAFDAGPLKRERGLLLSYMLVMQTESGVEAVKIVLLVVVVLHGLVGFFRSRGASFLPVLGVGVLVAGILTASANGVLPSSAAREAATLVLPLAVSLYVPTRLAEGIGSVLLQRLATNIMWLLSISTTIEWIARRGIFGIAPSPFVYSFWATSALGIFVVLMNRPASTRVLVSVVAASALPLTTGTRTVALYLFAVVLIVAWAALNSRVSASLLVRLLVLASLAVLALQTTAVGSDLLEYGRRRVIAVGAGVRDLSAQERLQATRIASRRISGSPLIGDGLGRAFVLVDQAGSLKPPTIHLDTPLDLFVDLGVLGGSAYLLSLISLTFRQIRRVETVGLVAFIVVASFISPAVTDTGFPILALVLTLRRHCCLDARPINPSLKPSESDRHHGDYAA